MRAYIVEDIVNSDMEKIINAFNELNLNGPIEGIYYLPLPEDLLQSEQKEHLEECGPYFMALECIEGTEEGTIKLELLVRGRKKIRCSCVTYATPDQRKHMINYLDQFIDELEISI